MAYDMRRSVLIDPWGGRKDIAKRVVRGVVSPEERFREDPLRLMRAVRIAAELGFRIDGKTLKAISSMAEAITAAAPERIRDELVRILLCEKPSQGLHLLKKTGLLGLDPARTCGSSERLKGRSAHPGCCGSSGT